MHWATAANANVDVAANIFSNANVNVRDDPSKRYTTMDPTYEAAQLSILSHMFSAGLISRGKKPVYWSPSSQTALAESELE